MTKQQSQYVQSQKLYIQQLENYGEQVKQSIAGFDKELKLIEKQRAVAKQLLSLNQERVALNLNELRNYLRSIKKTK